jgi:hypothetical protein
MPKQQGEQHRVQAQSSAGKQASRPHPVPSKLGCAILLRQAAQRAQRGPCARRVLRRSRDAAIRDERVRTADAKSGSGPGTSGTRGTSSERPARARGAWGAERRGTAREPGPGGTSAGRGAARLRSGAEMGRPAGPDRVSPRRPSSTQETCRGVENKTK